MNRRERETGAIALLALCVMAAVLWLGMSLFAIVDYGSKGSDEYLEETRLRLAAEGRIERLAKEIEKSPGDLDAYGRGTWEDYAGAESSDGVLVSIYLKRVAVRAGEEDVFLKAWAAPEKTGQFGQGKIVCGWLQRKGDSCVWRGWKPLEDISK